MDANIFFAAVRSPSGGSYFVIELAKRKRLNVVTVVHVLAEAERNITAKIDGDALKRHYNNLLAIQPRIQSLSTIPVVLEYRFRTCVAEKDIPIVLGAFLSKAPVLLTLDQKHLLHNTKLAALALPFSIMSPGDFLRTYF